MALFIFEDGVQNALISSTSPLLPEVVGRGRGHSRRTKQDADTLDRASLGAECEFADVTIGHCAHIAPRACTWRSAAEMSATA
eukprot:scaffold41444_cov31-Tisochrysis_lutea.AAC.6